MQYSMENVKALSFDLDDTLYDNGPVIKNAFLELYNYLLSHYPKIINVYDFGAFISAAQTMKKSHPATADLSLLRRLHIQQVLKNSGYESLLKPDLVEEAFDIFWQARQKVTLYPEVHKILMALSAKLPMVTLSNGNACIKAIGIDQYFQYSISTSDTGKPKPDSSMFLLACEKLAIEPAQLVHIGDNINFDIKGAKNAGCRSIWLNQFSEDIQNHQADAMINQLSELLDFNF